MDQAMLPGDSGREPYVVVAGFGLPGRSLVEFLVREHIEYMVIELNAQTCERAAAGGVHIIAGSARILEVLHQAQIERASMGPMVPTTKSC